MAEFAPVGPPQVLEYLKEHNALGNYHLLLAHEVAREPDRYVKLMSGSHRTIIMDNGAFELGTPVDSATMKKAVLPLREAGHNVIVALPDFIGSKQKTLDIIDTFYDVWERQRLGPFMFIPQGQNDEEWADCMWQLLDSFGSIKTEVDYEYKYAWGIPRFLGNQMGTRINAIQALHEAGIKENIHLLGFSKTPEVDLQEALAGGVMGIDSSEPLRAGLEGKIWNIRKPPKLETRKGDYWNVDMNITFRERTYVTNNVNIVRRAVSNYGLSR